MRSARPPRSWWQCDTRWHTVCQLFGCGTSTCSAPAYHRKCPAPPSPGRLRWRSELEGRGELHVGDLSGRRDFVDVRDAVRAYVLIAEMDKPGNVYNVCSERAFSIRSCLDLLMSMSKARLKVTIVPDSMQEHDVSIQIGSAKRLKHDTNWRPKTSLKQSLQDLLDYWRQNAGLEKEFG